MGLLGVPLLEGAGRHANKARIQSEHATRSHVQAGIQHFVWSGLEDVRKTPGDASRRCFPRTAHPAVCQTINLKHDACFGLCTNSRSSVHLRTKAFCFVSAPILMSFVSQLKSQTESLARSSSEAGCIWCMGCRRLRKDSRAGARALRAPLRSQGRYHNVSGGERAAPHCAPYSPPHFTDIRPTLAAPGNGAGDAVCVVFSGESLVAFWAGYEQPPRDAQVLLNLAPDFANFRMIYSGKSTDPFSLDPFSFVG